MTEARSDPDADIDETVDGSRDDSPTDRPGTETHDSHQQIVDSEPSGVGDDTPEPRWFKMDRVTLFVIIALGIGAFALVRGVLVGITGDDRADLPSFVEQVQPVPEAVQVLNQSNVFVDLATGYTGVLIIDGVELETVSIDELDRVDLEPGQQIDLPNVTIFESGNSTLTFTPNAAAPITQFVDGEHTVEVLYWRFDETRQRARSFTWTFTVV